MKAVVATPFITISKAMTSHRAAQGVIYADQLKQAGVDVTVNMTLDKYITNLTDKFDALYMYHGNDWSGHLNLFGGLKEFPYVDNFVNVSKFKGKIYSLVIPFPDYYADLQHKMDLAKSKDKKWHPLWDEVDWDNLQRMQREAEVVDPNVLVFYDRVATGDSHAICMYRPGWMVNSQPFKTLHGALKIGLEHFIFFNDKLKERKLKEIELYFGNIDVRHHLLRQPDPIQATKDLVKEYALQAHRIAQETGAIVRLYELLPIENERRMVPKTGFFMGSAFYGSQLERDRIRILFKDELKKHMTDKVQLFEWVNGMINQQGELGFEYMEKPQSIHLSREFYPHWCGAEWNGIDESTLTERQRVLAMQGKNKATLEDFFS